MFNVFGFAQESVGELDAIVEYRQGLGTSSLTSGQDGRATRLPLLVADVNPASRKNHLVDEQPDFAM